MRALIVATDAVVHAPKIGSMMRLEASLHVTIHMRNACRDFDVDLSQVMTPTVRATAKGSKKSKCIRKADKETTLSINRLFLKGVHAWNGVKGVGFQ
jgi:hypothetical protein